MSNRERVFLDRDGVVFDLPAVRQIMEMRVDPGGSAALLRDGPDSLIVRAALAVRLWEDEAASMTPRGGELIPLTMQLASIDEGRAASWAADAAGMDKLDRQISTVIVAIDLEVSRRAGVLTYRSSARSIFDKEPLEIDGSALLAQGSVDAAVEWGNSMKQAWMMSVCAADPAVAREAVEAMAMLSPDTEGVRDE